jgi:hypothetical protein
MKSILRHIVWGSYPINNVLLIMITIRTLSLIDKKVKKIIFSDIICNKAYRVRCFVGLLIV